MAEDTEPPADQPRLRLAGLIWTGTILVGLVVLGLLGLAAIARDSEDVSPDAFFVLVLAVVGFWYVLPEFRGNLAKYRAHRRREG